MEETSDPWFGIVASQKRAWRAIRWGPAVAITAVCLSRIPWLAAGLFVAWFGWACFRLAAIGEHRCPRCGNELFRNGAYHNSLASRCLNCKQAIGEAAQPLFPVAKTLPL
jgi:hypothetical protein